MIEDLFKHPETKLFLSDYPKAKWSICIESAFLYGLYCIKRDFPNGLSIPELMKISGRESYHSPTKSSVMMKFSTRNEETQTLKSSVPIENVIEKSRPEKPSSNAIKKFSAQTQVDIHKSKRDSIEDPIENNLDIERDSIVNSPIYEPKTCSLENAKLLLTEYSGEDMFKQKTGDEFLTRLQKRGLRKNVFPVLDIKISNDQLLNDSLGSSAFSISSSKY